jgi:hypothetical protein
MDPWRARRRPQEDHGGHLCGCGLGPHQLASIMLVLNKPTSHEEQPYGQSRGRGGGGW